MKRDRPKQASYAERHLGRDDDTIRVSNKLNSGADNGPIRRAVSEKIGADVAPIPKKPSQATGVNVSRVRQEPQFKAKKSQGAAVSSSPEGGKMIQYLSLNDIPDIDELGPSKPARKPAPVAFGGGNLNRQFDQQFDGDDDEEELRYIPQPGQRQQQPNLSHVPLPVSNKQGNNRNSMYDEEDDYSADKYSEYSARSNRNISYSPVQSNISKPSNKIVGNSSSSSNGGGGGGSGIKKKSIHTNSKLPRNVNDDNDDDFNNDAYDDDSPPRGHDEYQSNKPAAAGGGGAGASKLPAFPAEQQFQQQRQQVNNNMINKSKMAAAPQAQPQPQPVLAVNNSNNYNNNSISNIGKEKQLKQQDYRSVPVSQNNYVDSKPSAYQQQQQAPGRVDVSADAPMQRGYKPYTLEQYRQIKPKEYVEIPKIKPDLNRDDLIAKRANAERIKEFSKQLQEFNSQVAQNQRKLPPANEMNEISVSKLKEESKRERAAQFARQVPLPAPAKSKGNGRRKSSGDEPAAAAGGGRMRFDDNVDMGDYGGDENMMDYYYDSTDMQVSGAGGGGGAAEPSRLEMLQAKHAQSKRQVDAIKASIGMK